MSKQTYTLLPCAIADSPELAGNNIPAFREDITWSLFMAHVPVEEHVKRTAKRIPRNLINERPSTRHQKAVDTNGKIVGYARWSLPASRADLTIWPEALGPAVSKEEEEEIRKVAGAVVLGGQGNSGELDRPLGSISKGILARKEYLELDYIAVHPSQQGNGIATLLVREGMKQAERLGLDVFVMAFKGGFRLYEKLGFRVEKELVQDDRPYGGEGQYAIRWVIWECET